MLLSTCLSHTAPCLPQIAAHANAGCAPHEPCLVVTARTLSLGVAAGRLDATATGLAALAHVRSPEAGPGEETWTVRLVWNC